MMNIWYNTHTHKLVVGPPAEDSIHLEEGMVAGYTVDKPAGAAEGIPNCDNR